jgi:selenide,water dikinase
VLTKKLGTGIVANLRKLGGGLMGRARGLRAVAPQVEQEALASMATLNRTASLLMREFDCTACTDVTGFGLLGHAKNIADASAVALEIWVDRVPCFAGTLEAAVEGTAGGGHRNRDFVREAVVRHAGVTDRHLHLLCDAQTSGGLLMAVDASRADAFIGALHEAGVLHAAVIGEVRVGEAGRLHLRPAP